MARQAMTRGPVPAGPHATVEADDAAGFRIVVAVPFALESLAEARLDISAGSLVLQGPADELSVPLPEGFRLDPDRSTARYSRKRRQLVVSSPNAELDRAELPPPLETARPEEDFGSLEEPSGRRELPLALEAGRRAQEEPGGELPPALEAGRGTQKLVVPESDELPPPLETAYAAEEDDVPPPLNAARAAEEDDFPPPLEAARAADEDDLPPPLEAARAAEEPRTAPEEPGTNLAAEALMQQALAAREQKRKETEQARRSAGAGGLRKGFLAKAKPSKRAPAEVPFVAGTSDPRESLRLPEVQQALQRGLGKLQEDRSWLTPQLMQALQQRPDLLRGLSNPRVAEALRLMQSEPEVARQRYKDDAEVTAFLKEFSSLMATHFDVLGKGSGLAKAAPAVEGSGAGDVCAATTAAQPQLVEPEVAGLLKDPEVRELIESLRQGHPLEMHELCRGRPQLFHKVKQLLDSGLLSLQR